MAKFGSLRSLRIFSLYIYLHYTWKINHFRVNFRLNALNVFACTNIYKFANFMRPHFPDVFYISQPNFCNIAYIKILFWAEVIKLVIRNCQDQNLVHHELSIGISSVDLAVPVKFRRLWYCDISCLGQTSPCHPKTVFVLQSTEPLKRRDPIISCIVIQSVKNTAKACLHRSDQLRVQV